MRQTRLTLAFTAALAVAGFSSMAFAADTGAPPAAMAAPEASQTRLLVLPFTPLSDADRDAWIGRAISEALTADLSIDRTLSVSTDKQPAAGELAVALDVARAAKADRAVFGSFQKVGEEIRITGQIVDVAKGEAVGGLKATGPLQELFTLQDSLVHQIQIRMGRPGIPVAPPAPVAPPFTDQPVANFADDDDDGLGIPLPNVGPGIGPGIGWGNNNGPGGPLRDTIIAGRNRNTFTDYFTGPIYYNPLYFDPYLDNGFRYGPGFNQQFRAVGPGVGVGRPFTPRNNYYQPYYPSVRVTVTTSDGDGWNGRSQTQGRGMVGGGMRATAKYQPYQGVTPERLPRPSNAPTQASTLQVGNRRMYGPSAPAAPSRPAPAAPAARSQASDGGGSLVGPSGRR